jgi:integrase
LSVASKAAKAVVRLLRRDITARPDSDQCGDGGAAQIVEGANLCRFPFQFWSQRRQRVPTAEGRLQSLLDAYQQSQKFLGRRERTRADYVKQIMIIEQAFGDFPLKALAARETRGVFMDWRDRLALKSVRQADYAWTVLALVLAWAKDRGKISVNPCEKGGRLYEGTRVDFVWTIEDEAAFLKDAPAHLHLPLLLALWTGQRQGDLLRLPWSAYDGTYVRLRQSKTGAHVVIPVGVPLKIALDAAARSKQSTLMLVNLEGRPWTPDGFRASWGKAPLLRCS